MLEELSVKNFALIEALNLSVSEGFTVFSGETGAGKSILAGALGLLAGTRGTLEQIRTGAEEAEVSGVFALRETKELSTWLEDRGISAEDGRIIVRRILRRNGKNANYIQGSPSSLKDVSELSEFLFDMHGQHEHQTLFEPSFHRRYLDEFAGNTEFVEELKQVFLEMNAVKRKLETLETDESERLRERELLKFSVDEIEAANIQANEDETLEAELAILESTEDLKHSVEAANEALHGEETGALRTLYSAKAALSRLSSIDPKTKDWMERLNAVYFEVEDISSQLSNYRDRINIDPARLELVQERLDVLYKLKKMYGGSLESVLAYAQKSIQDLQNIENYDQQREELKKRSQALEKDVLRRATELTVRRRGAAEKMEARVRSALEGLKMGRTGFSVRVDQRKSEKGQPLCGPYGADDVEFLLSSNPGEPMKPLRSIASGGEISRIMLAVKSVLSELDGVDTLIFDEIDSGIGGEVGVAVGEYLYRTSVNRQLLAITHLASIAVRADNHVKISKYEKDGRTYTRAEKVGDEDRVVEIARMLSGHADHSTSLAHARELLQKYRVLGASHGKG